MIKITDWRLLAGIACVLFLGSCGGGGGGRYAGIDGSGSKPELSVVGPINGFGSVIVNGVRYNTDNAAVLVRGEPADEIDLNVGDYVTVVGGTNAAGEAIAYEVHYQPRVTGEVESVDQERNQFSVLGQKIQLLADTVYASNIMPRDIRALAPGQRVTVSGPLDADFVIQATRLAYDESPFVELVGQVANVDTFARRFSLNGQAVSYSPSLDNGGLAEGRLVVVRGALQDGVLVADTIAFHQDYRLLRNIPSIELLGIVQKMDGNGRFFMDSVPVKITSSTRFSGVDKASLMNNAKVRVVGALDKEDVLVAQEIEILSSPRAKIYGAIQEVYPIWGFYGLLGKIKVQDQEFMVQTDTRLTGEYERRINFWDLRVGDQVYVSSYPFGDVMVASSIAVDNRDGQAVMLEMQGVAYFASQSMNAFFIFNTKIVVSPETTYSRFDTPTDASAFFAVANNSYVRVRGYFEYGVLRAEHVQVFPPDYSTPIWQKPSSGTP
jgi:hypothetical protein